METRERAACGGDQPPGGMFGEVRGQVGDLTALGDLYAAPILSGLKTDKGYSSLPEKRHVGKQHMKQT